MINIDPETILEWAKLFGGWLVAGGTSLYVAYRSLPNQKKTAFLKWGNQALSDGKITVSELADGTLILTLPEES